MTKHECYKAGGGRNWMTCVACEGRIHLPNCTSKRDKHKDCCEARHQMLHDQGQTVGIVDDGVPMLPMLPYE